MLKENADFYLFQEIKASSSSLNLPLTISTKFNSYHYLAEKQGYSGLLIYSKQKANSVIKGIGIEEIDKEARILTLEYDDFYLINIYFPHSSRDLTRLPFKLRFNEAFANFCSKLKKPIIIGGDFNVAHKSIDLANPYQNRFNAGYTVQEKDWMTKFLDSGYTDSFRFLNNDPEWFTWWSYRKGVRDRNVGWRIDYFVVSSELNVNIKSCKILHEVYGSDHCPILLELI